MDWQMPVVMCMCARIKVKVHGTAASFRASKSGMPGKISADKNISEGSLFLCMEYQGDAIAPQHTV